MPPLTAIREQLDKILNSQALAGSDQLKRLLRVSVERTLDGQTDSTKEYTLGIEAFGRPDGYDPKVDPIVRVQARRLRTKLKEYYGTEGATDAIVIDMPKGGYIPAFETREAPRRKAIWALIAMAAPLIVGLVWLLRPRPTDPFSVAVLPIRNYSGDASKQYLADKTTDALITHLSRNKSLRVVSATTSRRFANSEASLPEIAKALSVHWVVEGGMGYERGQVLLKLRAVNGDTDRKGWADAYQTGVDDLSSTQAKAAAAIAEAISRPR
jgi:adenylate cyclase